MAGARSVRSGPGRAASGPSASAAPRYPIESVENVLRLLTLLSEDKSITVVEASTELGVARSTAHRLLAMLLHHRLAEQNDAKAYIPGPALIELGLAAISDVDIRSRVRPVLQRVVGEVNETAHLVVRRGTRVIFLDCVESHRALRAGSRIGQMVPAHCTASGKVMLADLEPDAFRRLYSEPRLEKLTPESISGVSHLERELAVVRERGYATNQGESETGLSAVAVSIKNEIGQIVGAITVAGPSLRLTREELVSIARHLKRYSAEATDSLSRHRRNSVA